MTHGPINIRCRNSVDLICLVQAEDQWRGTVASFYQHSNEVAGFLTSGATITAEFCQFSWKLVEKSKAPVLNVACTIGNEFTAHSSHPTLFPYFE